MGTTQVITPPVIPSSWTVSSIVSYTASLILFILGSLAQAGVVVPAHTATEVQVIVGVVAQIAAVVVTLVAHITNSSVVKTALRLRAGIRGSA